MWRLLLVHTVLIHAITLVLRPATSYRALELGVSPAWLGAVSASFALVPLMAAFWVGRATDVRGERPILVAGALLVLTSALLFATVGHSLPALVAFSAILGVGHLLSMVAGQSVVAHLAPPDDSDRWFGHYTFAASVGQLIGPGIISLTSPASRGANTGAMFAACVPIALVLLAVSAAMRSTRAVADGTEAPTRGAVRAVLRAPGTLRAILVSVAVLGAIDVLIVYLPALGDERGLSGQVIGLLLVVRGGAMMGSRFFLGFLSRRYGMRRVLVFGNLAAMVAIAVLPFTSFVPLLVVAVAVSGLGLGVGPPLTMSWVSQVAPDGLRATALSIRISGNRLGQIAVPAAVGVVAAGAGVGGVLLATSAVVGLAAASSSSVG